MSYFMWLGYEAEEVEFELALQALAQSTGETLAEHYGHDD